MEDYPIAHLLQTVAGHVALAIELVAVICVAVGVLRSLPLLFAGGRTAVPTFTGEPFLHLGRWLVLGLEYALAADIVRTAIAPSWNQVGMLGAIAVIRTFLNYFLVGDIERVLKRRAEVAANG